MLILSQAAQDVGGSVSGTDVKFSGVTTDSRRVAAGDLFVALRGEKYDGHQFVAQALQQGAVAAMVAQDWKAPRDVSLLRVADTRLALGSLAGAWRSRAAVSVVGITGSNGKTTVKEMLAGILRAHAGAADSVLATEGNLNNDIGLPLTLLRLREHHRFAVIEMGMNHRGEISYLTRLAAPSVALITNAQRAHVGLLGSVEGVARAKGEIFEGLGATGVAIINADDPMAYLWRELLGARKRMEFATAQPADITARFKLAGFGSDLRISTPVGEFSVRLQVPGLHNVRNALAACAAASALAIPTAIIATGLGAFAGVKGRMQRKAGFGGAQIIDDTYNANPDSAVAAIDVLRAVAGEKILVLGDMGELGSEAAALHMDIGAHAKRAGIDALFALGEMSVCATVKFGDGAQHFTDVDTLVKVLKPRLSKATTVLVKGSRFMRMERVVEACLAEPSQAKSRAA